MESISIHDDDDDSPLDDDDDELLIDTDDELETSSHSLISRMEGFDEESYDEDDYDEELLSDDEVLKRRLEQQVFHKLALGKDERDPTERRIAQIVLQYMEQANRGELSDDQHDPRSDTGFCSLAMDLD